MKHLPQLDGLRAVALLMVFVHHAYSVPYLWSGVDLFFILSGYLITNILLRDSERFGFREMLRQFYVRRAQRILPAYVMCLCLLVCFSRADWPKIWPYYTFFLQNVPNAFHLIPFGPLAPLWSLAVEQHFYLIWPLVVFFLPRRWLVPSMVTVLLVVPALRWFCSPMFPDPEPIYSLTPFRIDTIVAGGLAAVWLPRVQRAHAVAFGRAAMLLGVALLALLRGRPWFTRPANTPQFNCFAYSLNILVLGGFFLCVLLMEDGWLFSALTWPPLRALGRISYTFYLLHLLALQLAFSYIHNRTAPLVAFGVTAAVATLSWKLIESPVLSLRLSGSPRHGAAAT